HPSRHAGDGGCSYEPRHGRALQEIRAAIVICPGVFAGTERWNHGRADQSRFYARRQVLSGTGVDRTRLVGRCVANFEPAMGSDDSSRVLHGSSPGVLVAVAARPRRTPAWTRI